MDWLRRSGSPRSSTCLDRWPIRCLDDAPMSSGAPPDRSRRVASALGSLIFFWVAPVTVAGWIPWAITGWRMRSPLLGVEAGRWLGGAMIAVGALAVVECFVRFALEGLGTPAPVAPTRTL